MHIPERYRDRYDALAEEHPWMREMRDGTNGDGGGTNGIHADAPLVDPVEIMRKVANGDEVTGNAMRKEVGGADWADALLILADMVERDYVRRDGYDFTVDALKYMKAERDEALEIRDKAIGDAATFKYERDELKRKLEIADRHEFDSDQACDECKYHTDELLSELTAERDEWKTKYETCEFAYKQADAERKRYSEQIDELRAERDEWKAKAEAKSAKRAAAVERLRMLDEFGGGSFEYAILGSDKMAWSYMDKRDALIDLLTDSPMDAHGTANGTCPDANRTASNDSGHSADMTQKNVVCVRNDGEMSEVGVRTGSVDANDGNENLENNLGSVSKVGSEIDSREKLCTLDVYGKDGKLHSSTNIPKPSWEPDSREKLEADIRGHFWHYDWCRTNMVLAWLDRQAAITERELESKFLDRADEIITRRELEKRGLQKQVDSLVVRAVAAEEEADELTAIVDRLTDDREIYRDLCSQMLDAMDAVRVKVDASFPRGAKEVM